MAAWLALPQSAMPNHLPLPRIAASELTIAQQVERTAAEQARKQPLAYAVRATGESFRQLGRLVHGGEPLDTERRDRFRGFVAQARRDAGDEPLRRLRAVQAQLFVEAVNRWKRTGVEDDDLIELGGDFLVIARDLGWLRVGERGRTRPSLDLDDAELRALFLSRWTDLAGLGDDADLGLSRVWPLLALRARLRLPLERLSARDLKLIERVKRLAPEYPDSLSQGLLFTRLGERERAIGALEQHLRQRSDGPYTLRARNHLFYAIEKLSRDGE